MGHQGRVLDADGLPADGPHTLDFHLYDAAEDGTMVWSEVHDVELINGYYSLVLGADELDNPLDDSLLRDNELHLELTVDDDVPLSPRQALNAVPYARIATSATNVSGGTVDASEIRVGGSVVVDSSGGWVGATPSVSWDDLSDVPEDVDTVLSEDEVDAYCSNNGYALASDIPHAISGGALGIHAEHFTESGSFAVPDGITTVIVYVTGGGGGGSNGAATALDLGGHSHGVGEHSHDGGTHTHGIGGHAHQDGLDCTATSPPDGYGGGGGCIAYAPHFTSASSGSTGTVDDGSTGSTGLTTNEGGGGGGSINTTGGDGGSGGGLSAMLQVTEGVTCEISLGDGGGIGGAGTDTTVDCGEEHSILCTAGAGGAGDGSNGLDGRCTSTGTTALSQFKASNSAPGGGGLGSQVGEARTGQSGSVTIRY
jgi:hypothetical protein